MKSPLNILILLFCVFVAGVLATVATIVAANALRQRADKSASLTNPFSAHVASHALQPPNQAPGGCARHRGSSYLSIGCRFFSAPESLSAVRGLSAATVMASEKQYGVAQVRLTLPIDNNFPHTKLNQRPSASTRTAPTMAVIVGGASIA